MKLAIQALMSSFTPTTAAIKHNRKPDILDHVGPLRTLYSLNSGNVNLAADLRRPGRLDVWFVSLCEHVGRETDERGEAALNKWMCECFRGFRRQWLQVRDKLECVYMTVADQEGQLEERGG